MDLSQLRKNLDQRGLRLHPADPALDMVLICDTALRDTVRSMEEMLKATTDRMAADQVKANEDAERRAVAHINKASEWLTGRFNDLADKAVERVLSRIQPEIEKAEEMRRASERASWAAAICMAATAVLFVCMIIKTLRL